MTTTKTLLDISQLAGTIQTGTYTFTTEDELQAGISEHLTAAGIEHTREVRLSAGLGRVDLMVGQVAVEVKIAGGWQALARQVMRYTHAAEVDGILVVTTKMAHLQALPTQMGAKPIIGMFLNGAF
jgi:hypothetical protein